MQIKDLKFYSALDVPGITRGKSVTRIDKVIVERVSLHTRGFPVAWIFTQSYVFLAVTATS